MASKETAVAAVQSKAENEKEQTKSKKTAGNGSSGEGTYDADSIKVLGGIEALPRIRDRVEADLRLRGIPRRKVLALVVRLLQDTSIRIGNDEYRRENRSFGLTTMLDRHARFDGPGVRFEFKGKSGRVHSVRLTDRRLARIVKRCQEIPGQELFPLIEKKSPPVAIFIHWQQSPVFRVILSFGAITGNNIRPFVIRVHAYLLVQLPFPHRMYMPHDNGVKDYQFVFGIAQYLRPH